MKNFIPAIIWAGIILWLSAGPGVNLPESWADLFAADKIGHVVFYMILSMLMLWGYERTSRKKKMRSNIAYVFAIAGIIYGVLMEIMQYAFFPGRYFEVLDIIANIIGSFTGLYLYIYFFIKKS